VPSERVFAAAEKSLFEGFVFLESLDVCFEEGKNKRKGKGKTSGDGSYMRLPIFEES
jgi:hypothetical protein